MPRQLSNNNVKCYAKSKISPSSIDDGIYYRIISNVTVNVSAIGSGIWRHLAIAMICFGMKIFETSGSILARLLIAKHILLQRYTTPDFLLALEQMTNDDLANEQTIRLFGRRMASRNF